MEEGEAEVEDASVTPSLILICAAEKLPLMSVRLFVRQSVSFPSRAVQRTSLDLREAR